MIYVYYQRVNMVHIWGKCHQWRYLLPLLQPWPQKWFGGHSAGSHASALAATRPLGFLTFATPTGKTGGWFSLHNEDVRRFMQHCGARRNSHSQYAPLCYFTISISQSCRQEQLNISQSNSKLWRVNLSIAIVLEISFLFYRCLVPGISCLQEHPEGAHSGPEHMVPKCEAVSITTSRWQ